MTKHIELYGCREGNLKGIDVKIPYGQITVIAGVSGSGKSSLAFKTIFAEGRRRIVESLDFRESYYFSDVSAPKIDIALGLPPAIAISQTKHIRNPKSTLGSISHVNHFLYSLFASCGDIRCESCVIAGNMHTNPPHLHTCRHCGQPNMGMQPAAFSNMSPVGMCQECGGTGLLRDVDESLIYPDQKLSVGEGGLLYGGPTKGTMKYQFFENLLGQFGFSNSTPIESLSKDAKVALLFGVKKTRKCRVEFPGIVPMILKTYRESSSPVVRADLQRFMVEKTCPNCNGHGISPRAAAVTIDGMNIQDMMSMSVDSLVSDKLKHLKFNDIRDSIAVVPLRKMIETLETMRDLGIGYLTLSRSTASLSGGEMHRARMAAQLAAQITGVVYVLDEPSSGLHSEEVGSIIAVMKKLRDCGSGNTVVAVEHDMEIIGNADHIIELGPGPAKHGGRVICAGTPRDLSKNTRSLIGKLLKCPHQASKHTVIVGGQTKYLNISKANANNLKNVNIDIPLHCIVAVTGISGSGKSSLVFDSLCMHGTSGTSRTRHATPCHLRGRRQIGDIILSDQSPIGKSARSVVATYINVFAQVRRLFAKTAQAKAQHLDEGHFSFNTQRGCCQTCKGYGTIEFDNTIFSGAQFTCPECGGKRFNEMVLSVKYKNRSIADILAMDISDARTLFDGTPGIARVLDAMQRVGLGYLMLGQDTMDLSGGEAQRLKLASDLARGKSSNALYVFDEPSSGLHANDIDVLIGVFAHLVNSGNSVVVVEHDLQVIAASDFVIEMGPGAGECGGEIVATGTPGEVAKTNTSTGRALRSFFSSSTRRAK